MIECGLIDPGIKTPPIYFHGREYAATKVFWEGTQRTVAPAETVERVRPHFPRLGVTRLANITELDRIGIPTVLSVRPQALTVSVDSGKGFTLEAATASAVMESVERYHAEVARPPQFRASYDSAAGEHTVVPFDHLIRVKAAHFTRHMPINWTLGWDLLGEREVAVPVMMVRLDKSGASERLPLPFSSDSNGLAAGNNLLEALNYGLAECIERDAVTCWRLAWGNGCPPPRVRLETIEHGPTCELLDRCRRADVRVVLLDCTVDTAVPVYQAYLYDRVSPHSVLSCGYGAHLDPGVAMVRAITEAVQGRLVYIAGTRDDFFRHVDLRCRVSDDVATVNTIESLAETVDVRERLSLATPTFEGDIRFLLRRLEAVGIRQAIAFDLTLPIFGLPAVRIVVPGLEGCDTDFAIAGARARAFRTSAMHWVNQS